MTVLMLERPRQPVWGGGVNGSHHTATPKGYAFMGWGCRPLGLTALLPGKEALAGSKAWLRYRGTGLRIEGVAVFCLGHPCIFGVAHPDFSIPHNGTNCLVAVELLNECGRVVWNAY